MSYQHPDDLALIPELLALAPDEAKTFLAFNHAAERADGAIPAKYRELIALGVAFTTQCAIASTRTHATRAKPAPPSRRSPRRPSSQRPCGPAARWLTRC
jgi:alkylhydroperoxidase/carboxymuconolactone decarboxylase family protein YurZ